MIWVFVAVLVSIPVGFLVGYWWATGKAREEFFEKYMYCPTCNACGESGCCEPSQCKRFVCIHGSEYLNEHEMEWQLLADAEASLIEREAEITRRENGEG